jgi:leucyl-tRNA synthetase
MGFDAFGLPAENYAIKTGIHPNESIAANVKTMIKQLKRIGCMYDWSKMVNTSQPEYYRWTQWLFLEMFKHGLAYKKQGNVNFCPKCQTVLANEQVWEGKCERCSSDVVQKALEQWYWQITKYAQQLLDGLQDLDWPEKTKLMQRNWIDRSEGVNFSMKVKGADISFEVYDSIPQTFKAQTFVVIAPEHPLVPELVKGTKHEKSVLEFVERIKKKKAAKRFDFQEDLEGIDTGRVVENPFGMGDLPIWVASFVVMEYGTGIVSCSSIRFQSSNTRKMSMLSAKILVLLDSSKGTTPSKIWDASRKATPSSLHHFNQSSRITIQKHVIRKSSLR